MRLILDFDLAQKKGIESRLANIAAYPSMYLSDGSFSSISSFVGGVLFGLEAEEDSLSSKFSDWMKEKYKKVGPLTYASISIVLFDEMEGEGKPLNEKERGLFLLTNLSEFLATR